VLRCVPTSKPTALSDTNPNPNPAHQQAVVTRYGAWEVDEADPVRIVISDEGDEVLVSITDRGLGVPQDHFTHMFDCEWVAGVGVGGGVVMRAGHSVAALLLCSNRFAAGC